MQHRLYEQQSEEIRELTRRLEQTREDELDYQQRIDILTAAHEEEQLDDGEWGMLTNSLTIAATTYVAPPTVPTGKRFSELQDDSDNELLVEPKRFSVKRRLSNGSNISKDLVDNSQSDAAS